MLPTAPMLSIAKISRIASFIFCSKKNSKKLKKIIATVTRNIPRAKKSRGGYKHRICRSILQISTYWRSLECYCYEEEQQPPFIYSFSY
jgi:hypothetical protein